MPCVWGIRVLEMAMSMLTALHSLGTLFTRGFLQRNEKMICWSQSPQKSTRNEAGGTPRIPTFLSKCYFKHTSAITLLILFKINRLSYFCSLKEFKGKCQNKTIRSMTTVSLRDAGGLECRWHIGYSVRELIRGFGYETVYYLLIREIWRKGI